MKRSSLSGLCCIQTSAHCQRKKQLQLVCIHIYLPHMFSTVKPCRVLLICTCVSLSVVRNANTLRGIAVARGSRWSPHSWRTRATRRATRPSRARRTWGTCSWLSWWTYKVDERGWMILKHKTCDTAQLKVWGCVELPMTPPPNTHTHHQPQLSRR